MAGLLDVFNTEEGQQALGLLAAAGPRFDGAGFGQRLMEGLSQGQKWKAQQQEMAARKQQQEYQAWQIQQAKDHALQQQVLREGVGKYFKPAQEARPAAPAMDGMLPQEFRTGAMPMGAQPAQAPSVDVAGLGTFLAKQGDYKGGIELLQSLQPKETKLSKGEAVFKDGKKIYDNPDVPELPTTVREFQFAQQNPAFTPWMLQGKRAGATSVNVPISMDKGFGEVFAKEAASDLGASRDSARSAANNVQTLGRINQIIDSGKVVVGPTAPFETFGRQLGSMLGVGGKSNDEVLANTRKLMQGAATLAADGSAMLAKQGQITDGERALISRAAGGDIDKMTMPEIKALTGVLSRVNALKVNAHNQRLQNVDPKFSPFVPFYKVDVQQPYEQPAQPSVMNWGDLK